MQTNANQLFYRKPFNLGLSDVPSTLNSGYVYVFGRNTSEAMLVMISAQHISKQLSTLMLMILTLSAQGDTCQVSLL